MIHVDHDLTLFSSIRKGYYGTGYGNQLGADEIESQIVQLLLGQAFACEAQLQNGNARGAEVNNLGRLNRRW